MADLHSNIIEKPIIPGAAIRLSDLVVRVTAPNGGPMTGPGTNTYLVGKSDITVVDPGPNIPSHVEAILHAGAGKIRRVAVTHTHADHSPAAKPIADASGASLHGSLLCDDGHQDLGFKPDHELRHGDTIVGADHCIEALHTPGHVGNHFCFYLPEEKTIFTGDHIMQGATVVIIPPSGDMLDYINSLELLTHYDAERLAPAHGHLLADAHRVAMDIIKHRLGREEKVISALRQIPDATLDQLMDIVYADVDKELYKVATMSLWAHLLKLEREGRASKHAEKHWLFDDELWRLNEVSSR